ncbi:Pyruvate kinase [Seminavis robusta]|uniref:Pyruvate kinase n=1 Tax=Seminavis robusta TaxID=568900 RepID=A0A9N8HDN2_9STRA|nr:Pyruvate kinase [Seminavis robusta]|eukprot:Sro266_g103070.1 Pyruvate kinase (580) ;mRNA; f:22657-24624
MSVSNTSEVPTLSGRNIDLDMIKRQSYAKYRRTKIFCTIGPACWEVPQLESMIDAGMDIARFNFSHGDHKGHFGVLERVRHAAELKERNIAILLDTKGPEIRSGFFANDAKKIDLVKGETIVLTSDYSFKGDKTKLGCSYDKLAESVTVGQSILVADGSLVLTVQSIDTAAKEVACRIENNASIGERKNMNLPGVVVDLPTFTEKDVDDIVNFGIKHNVDYIAASFVRKGSDVLNLRKLLKDNGGEHIQIICKIENQEGLQNYDDILEHTDGIMVARGDLGMEIPLNKVFLAQKYMIRKANLAGKPVVTATQMLESMINNPRPTRAECSDVANAVYDGTDAVMLSGETANGDYFEQAVKIMARTCSEAENSRNYNAMYQSVRNSVIDEVGGLSPGESLASSAVKTAIDTHAAFIVVLSESGTTARYVAKYQPGRLVICLTLSPTVARQTNGFLKCVRSFVVDSLDDSWALSKKVGSEAVKGGLAVEGQLMVVLAGKQSGKGATDACRVEGIVRDYDEQPPTFKVGEVAPKRAVGHLNAGFHLPKNRRYTVMQGQAEVKDSRKSLMHLSLDEDIEDEGVE